MRLHPKGDTQSGVSFRNNHRFLSARQAMRTPLAQCRAAVSGTAAVGMAS